MNRLFLVECSSKDPSLENIKNLIENGADINTLNGENNSPIHLLCKIKNISDFLIKFLKLSQLDFGSKHKVSPTSFTNSKYFDVHGDWFTKEKLLINKIKLIKIYFFI